MVTKVSVVYEASVAHDEARGLPACRPERVKEVLWDWALNYESMDVQKIMEELRHLYSEQFAAEASAQINSGNE